MLGHERPPHPDVAPQSASLLSPTARLTRAAPSLALRSRPTCAARSLILTPARRAPYPHHSLLALAARSLS